MHTPSTPKNPGRGVGGVGVGSPPGILVFWADGASRHLATCELQNFGRNRFRLTLPRGIAREDLRGVWVDGDPASWRLLGTEEERYVWVELPADRKFPA